MAQAILQFVRRCAEDPTQLQAACAEFPGLPYTKGLQTGMLTPILNALRPETFLLINGKSGQVVNYLAATSPDIPPKDYLFTTNTFALLADLHEHPVRELYAAQKDTFRIAVEHPFQALFRRVAAQLSPPLTVQLETERHLFGRILKND